MIKSLKLGQKITLGFFIVLSLLSTVVLVSISALTQADFGISQYQTFAHETNLVSKLQADMLKVRMSVRGYLVTQDEKELEDYRAHLAKMKELLSITKAKITNPARAQLVFNVDDALTNYDTSFERVVELIANRDSVYENQLLTHGEAMSKIINSIIYLAYDESESESAYYAAQIQQTILTGQLHSIKFYQSGSQKDYETAIQKVGGSIKQDLTDLNMYLNREELTELLADFESEHTSYIQSLNEINRIINEREQVVNNALNIIGPDIEHKVNEINTLVSSEQNTLGPKLKEKTNNSILLSVSLAVIAIVIGIAAAYRLATMITRPVKLAMNAANQLAEGDLTIEITSMNRDEVGMMIEALQNTAYKLREMIATISEASTQLANESEQLTTITEQTTIGILHQEQETDQVASAMEQMASTVNEVASHTTNASRSAIEADKEATIGANVMADTVIVINQLVDSVNQSSERLHDVAIDVANINTILDVITGVAEQTNLLALNAAIESARAGEHGRGFAVVADEVRSLAKRTQDSTREIQKIIEKLQSGTHNTVKAMDQGKVYAEKCVKQANIASEVLASISKTISEISDMNMQIASASEEQSLVAGSINENVVNVRQVAKENSVATTQTRHTSSEIANYSEQLKSLVEKFVV